MEIFIFDGMICLKPYTDDITTKSMISDLMKVIEANEDNIELKKYVNFKLKEAVDVINHFEQKAAERAADKTTIQRETKE